MPLVELVSHCYAVQFPHYAGALCYQLSSLALHPPEQTNVEPWVCLCKEDQKTMKVVEWFQKNTDRFVNIVYLTKEELGRRCIGRNIVAKQSKADFVWFADVDQVFRNGVLDRLVELDWPDGAVMIHPKKIKIHKDHATGDEYLARVTDDPGLVDIDPADFIDKRYGKAIGGVQIVKGDFARQHGYLECRPEWRQPRTDGKPFGDFRDDLAYRGVCGKLGTIVGVELEGMYRLRHTTTSYQGPKRRGG